MLGAVPSSPRCAKNPGFGLLTVNGAANMQWQWIVTDEINPGRNNTAVITYGPITP